LKEVDGKCILFVNSNQTVNELREILKEMKIEALAIHPGIMV